MAPALSQISCHGMSEGGNLLKVLQLLQLMLSVEARRAICMMVQGVGRARCRFRHDSWKEADPSGGSADPDWEMFQTVFHTGGGLQDPCPVVEETQCRVSHGNS